MYVYLIFLSCLLTMLFTCVLSWLISVEFVEGSTSLWYVGKAAAVAENLDVLKGFFFARTKRSLALVLRSIISSVITFVGICRDYDVKSFVEALVKNKF